MQDLKSSFTRVLFFFRLGCLRQCILIRVCSVWSVCSVCSAKGFSDTHVLNEVCRNSLQLFVGCNGALRHAHLKVAGDAALDPFVYLTMTLCGTCS